MADERRAVGDSDLLLVLGGVTLALGAWKIRTIAPIVADVFTKGSRLNVTKLDAIGVVSYATPDPDGNLVHAEPDVLITEAAGVMGRDVSRDAYALARMRRSEGTVGAPYRMHVMLNQAAAGNWASVFDLIVYSKYSNETGFFGTQAGRRCASSQDPYEGDVNLADQVLAERAAGIDPTGGASNFVDRSGFGKQPGTRSFEDVYADWTSQGLTPYNVPGVSSDFILWRKGSIPDGATLVTV